MAVKKPIPRYDRLPDCAWTQTGNLRVYIKREPDGFHENILEMLYEDGNGEPFWAPLPKVESEPPP